MKRSMLLIIGCASLFAATSLQAQEWSEAQAEVWQTISKQWEMAAERNTAWFDMLHDDFQGWSTEVPVPRDKAATQRFEAAEASRTTTVAQDLAPLAIVVAGDTAVAHYYYSTITEDQAGKRETTHGRYTDVLSRGEDGWEFVAWSGGELPGHEH